MPQLLVTTGPESSGKTTLAHQLASSLDLPLVPECARSYLNQRLQQNPGWHYQEEDLQHIATQQFAAERRALERSPRVVCDTDLLVIHIWSEEKYRQVAGPLEQLFKQALEENRLFLLCSPDMPWEPDPLRENPGDRWRLFERYQELLERWCLPYLILAGPAELRLRTVLDHLRRPAATTAGS